MFVVFIKDICLFLLINLNKCNMCEDLKKKQKSKIVLLVVTFNVLTNNLNLLTFIFLVFHYICL